jgi:hypothetical protein
MTVHVLPSSYERLEYIENTSTAYIDCGLPPKYTYDYEIKAYVLSGNIVLGYMVDGKDHVSYRFFYVNNNFYFDVGRYRLIMEDIMVLPNITTYHVKFGNYYINSIYPSKNPKVGPTFNETMNGAYIKNLFLFGDSTSRSKTGKIYFLKIKDRGKFIRYFIPAKRKLDGEIGMYDLVGRKFYTSPNGVAFTGG